MKRGEPLKRTELKRVTPLQPGRPLQPGSGLRRSTPLQAHAGRESLSARAGQKSAPRRSTTRRDPGPPAEVVEAVVDRDRLSCCRCGYGIGPNERGRRWSLHHRLRRSQGVQHTPQNLILLCGGSEAPGCHGLVHDHPEEARRFGWLLRGRDEPLAVPIYIPLEDRWVWLSSTGQYVDVPKEAS